MYPRLSSPFYKAEYRHPAVYGEDNILGPPQFGPYQERYVNGYWRRPDGSRAMAGLSGGIRALGDMVLPELDLSAGGGVEQRSLMGTLATLGIGAAALIGLGGWWLWSKQHKIAGGVALGVAGIAAVGGISSLIQAKSSADAAATWRAA